MHDRYKAKAVGKAMHLYSLKRDAAEPDVKMERYFLGPLVDEPASLVHKAIASSGVRSLAEDQKIVWSRFLVSLILRVPAMMAHLRARGRTVLERGLDEDAEGYRDVRGEATEETLKDWVQKHRPWEFDDLGVNTLPHLVGSRKLNTVFLQNAIWATRRLRATSMDFLIADRPLIYVGQMDKSFLCVLPLSPRLAFFACDKKATWDNVNRNTDRVLAQDINRAMVGNAERYVYATSAQHEPLIHKYLRKAMA